MIVNLFKLIVIGLFVYIVYSLYKFISTIKKNIENAQENMKRRAEEDPKVKNSRRGGKDVIELDKDQYRVD